jgi:hypothetical protein
MMSEEDKRTLLKKLVDQSISDLEYRQLELAALDDPFLFDALEGYAGVKNHAIAENIAKVDARINEKIKGKKRRSLFVYMMAATFIGLMITASFLFSSKFNQKDNNQIVNNQAAIQTPNVTKDEQIVETGDIRNQNVEITESGVIDKNEGILLSSDMPARSKQEIKRKYNKKNLKENKNNLLVVPAKEFESFENQIFSEVAISESTAASKNDLSELEKSKMVDTSTEGGEVMIAYDAKKSPQDDNTNPLRQKIISIPNSSFLPTTNVPKVWGESNSIIFGKVKDKDGEPIIGAKIIFGKRGTITDVDGSFRFEVDGRDTTLLVTYTGYNDERVAINRNKSDYEVIMNEGQLLDEIVLTGNLLGKGKETIKTKELKSIDNFKLKVEVSMAKELKKKKISTNYYAIIKLFYNTASEKIVLDEIIESSNPEMNDVLKKVIEKHRKAIPSNLVLSNPIRVVVNLK